MNRKVFITIILLIVAVGVLSKQMQVRVQTVAPECFEKDECWQPIKDKFCGVEYDCVAGQCYHQDIHCPEICNSLEDEDLDGLIGCEDPNCWADPFCDCYKASFRQCINRECFCDAGIQFWVVTGGEGVCECR